jgi:single-strand DNA-binding protein
MLRVSLLGNLGADPELRYSQKGTAIASFRVAVNQLRTGPDGERQENTEWFRIKASGRLADSAQRLAKGMRVLVVGRLDISHYQSREGDTRVGFDVWADDVLSVGNRTAAFDPEAADGGEAAAEPALAGVSSVGPAERRGAANANGASATNGRGRAAPAGDELEDLPF